jgi:hypothetical protein
MGQAYGTSNAGRKANAVVRSRNIVVHSLGDGDNFNSQPMKMDSIAESIITANGN